MNHIQACLFDADGVLTVPEALFTTVYCKSRGLDPGPFNDFFKNDFPAARVGKADLKQLIENNPSLWRWQGTADELLSYWFRTEDVRNEPLIAFIQQLRNSGIPCFVATNQEKYRAHYLQETMFQDKIDGCFASASLAVEKPSIAFFEKVMDELCTLIPELTPQLVAFVDDSEANVAAAWQVGMQAIRYQSVAQIESLFHDLVNARNTTRTN